jgi:hypothetical protein
VGESSLNPGEKVINIKIRRLLSFNLVLIILLFSIFMSGCTRGEKKDSGEVGNIVSASDFIQEFKVWEIDGFGEALKTDKVVLSLKARIDSLNLAGHTNIMGLYVSGQEIDSLRLVNKDLVFQTENGSINYWYSRSGWRLLYSPNYLDAEKPGSSYTVIGGGAYDFVFDVTDLFNRNRPIEIRIKNLMWDSLKKPIIISDLKIERLTKEEYIARFGGGSFNGSEDALKMIVPKWDTSIDYKLEVKPNGGLQVEFKDRLFSIISEFSSPTKEWNYFGISDGKDLRNKKIFLKSVKEVSPTEYEIIGECESYRIIRRVLKRSDHMDFYDEIINLSQEDIGIIIKNQVHTCERDNKELKPDILYLRGIKIPTKEGRTFQPENPTVFWANGDMGMGLVAVDDVYRVHSELYLKDNVAGIDDPYFAIAAGETYTIKWSLYLVKSNDYYDFINAIRRDWEVNFTLHGFGAFFRVGKTQSEYMEWLDTTGVKYPMSMISGSYKDIGSGSAHGSGFANQASKYRFGLAESIRTMKNVKPQIFPIVYFHAQISTEDGAGEKYKDSRVILKTMSQGVYSSSTLPLFYGTLENSYGQELFKYMNLVMDEIGASGVYWDEMSYSRYPYTYDVWDGHTGEISQSSMQLTRKMAHIALLTQPLKLALIEQVQNKGGIFIANGHPVTETMSKVHFPRFVETGSLSHLTKGHLYSPIGLGDHLSEKSSTDVYEGVLAHLEYGTLYYCYNQVPDSPDNILSRMYPITPLELHNGYIIGEERIITSKTGLYGWDDNSEFVIYLYGKDGRVKENNFRIIEETGKRYAEVILEKGESVIIERID